MIDQNRDLYYNDMSYMINSQVTIDNQLPNDFVDVTKQSSENDEAFLYMHRSHQLKDHTLYDLDSASPYTMSLGKESTGDKACSGKGFISFPQSVCKTYRSGHSVGLFNSSYEDIPDSSFTCNQENILRESDSAYNKLIGCDNDMNFKKYDVLGTQGEMENDGYDFPRRQSTRIRAKRKLESNLLQVDPVNDQVFDLSGERTDSSSMISVLNSDGDVCYSSSPKAKKPNYFVSDGQIEAFDSTKPDFLEERSRISLDESNKSTTTEQMNRRSDTWSLVTNTEVFQSGGKVAVTNYIPQASFSSEGMKEGIRDCLDELVSAYEDNYEEKREEYSRNLYDFYNHEIFENKLPSDTVIKWNPRLRYTSGYCTYKLTAILGSLDRRRTVCIALATKILDTADRLRDTMIHEMCHAAAWIINGDKNGHGQNWHSWSARATGRFPQLFPINICHRYDIYVKYTYTCENCGYIVKRHSKSIDVKWKRCGKCYGKFVLSITPLPQRIADRRPKPTPKRGRGRRNMNQCTVVHQHHEAPPTSSLFFPWRSIESDSDVGGTHH